MNFKTYISKYPINTIIYGFSPSNHDTFKVTITESIIQITRLSGSECDAPKHLCKIEPWSKKTKINVSLPNGYTFANNIGGKLTITIPGVLRVAKSIHSIDEDKRTFKVYGCKSIFSWEVDMEMPNSFSIIGHAPYSLLSSIRRDLLVNIP